MLYFYYPAQNDWTRIFVNLKCHFLDPYSASGFTNPPWAILLLPHVYLPVQASNALNMMLNIVILALIVRKFEGGWIGLLLTFTSPFFFDLARVNPIDWVPWLGLLLPTMWGLPLIAAKPQSVGMVALILWKKEKFRFRVLIPLIVVIIISFVVWGFWITSFRKDLINMMYNFSFWPLGIPIGLYLIYRAYKTDDESLAALSTLFLVPYLAPYSFTGLVAILSGKHRTYAIFLYIAGWWFFVVESRRALGIV